MTTDSTSTHRVFQQFDVSKLAARTGYSEIYLVEVKTGKRPVTSTFRKKLSAILGEPEAVLFAASEGSDGGTA